jgi:hypothetical protein
MYHCGKFVILYHAKNFAKGYSYARIAYQKINALCR